MSIQCRCTQKHRDKQGKIYGYTLVDKDGKTVNMYSDALKDCIKNGTLEVTNLTLTDDNRLINKRDTDNQIKEEIGKEDKDTLELSYNKLKILGCKINEEHTRYGNVNVAYLNEKSIIIIIPDNLKELAKFNKSKTIESYTKEVEGWIDSNKKDSINSQLLFRSRNIQSVKVMGGSRLEHIQNLLVGAELDTVIIDGSKLLNVTNASKIVYGCKIKNLIIENLKLSNALLNNMICHSQIENLTIRDSDLSHASLDNLICNSKIENLVLSNIILPVRDGCNIIRLDTNLMYCTDVQNTLILHNVESAKGVDEISYNSNFFNNKTKYIEINNSFNKVSNIEDFLDEMNFEKLLIKNSFNKFNVVYKEGNPQLLHKMNKNTLDYPKWEDVVIENSFNALEGMHNFLSNRDIKSLTINNSFNKLRFTSLAFYNTCINEVNIGNTSPRFKLELETMKHISAIQNRGTDFSHVVTVLNKHVGSNTLSNMTLVDTSKALIYINKKECTNKNKIINIYLPETALSTIEVGEIYSEFSKHPMYNIDWMLTEMGDSIDEKFTVTLKVIGGKNLLEPTELIAEDSRVKFLDTSEFISERFNIEKLAHKMHLYHLK